jgi:hypothetical protein
VRDTNHVCRAEFVGALDQDQESSSDFKLQHTSHQDVDFGPNLFHHVTISKAEHEYLVSKSWVGSVPA